MNGQQVGRKVQFQALPVLLLIGGLFGLLVTAPGRAVEIADIPRPQRWVSDPTGSIRPSAVAEIETTADRIERETGGQLVVVVVGTLDGKEARPFATELFNAWKIGRAKQNDGVLFFVALEDHRAELLLGSGLDDPERQRASDEIMQQVMVPQFKAGDPGEALVLGVRECARRIYGLAAPVEADQPSPLPAAGLETTSPNPRQAEVESVSPWAFGMLRWLFALAAIAIALVLLRRNHSKSTTNWTQRMADTGSDSSSFFVDSSSSADSSSFAGSSSFDASSSSGSDSSFGGGSTDGGGSSGHW